MATGIPVLNIKLSNLEVQTHEKYGESLILKNNCVEIEGKVYKLTCFPTFEKIVHNGREVSVKTTCLAFREVVGATVPKVVPKEEKTFNTAKAVKAPKAQDALEDRVAKMELGLAQILAAVSGKA